MNAGIHFTAEYIKESGLKPNHPKLNEYVGQCGGTGNPHVCGIIYDDEVMVKIRGMQPVKCMVKRDANGILQAVKLL